MENLRSVDEVIRNIKDNRKDLKTLFAVENGNSVVVLFEDGTRVVETKDEDCNYLDLDLPLSLDINISNACSNNCPYCYAGNTPFGKVADLLSMDYLDNITGIEIAINIQYPLPENFKFWLSKMKDQNIIVNGTINQLDFERDITTLYLMRELKQPGLLHGLGVSYRKYDKNLYMMIKKELGNDVVIHVIAYVTPFEDVKLLLKEGFKVLILGYKVKNRGLEYFNKIKTQDWDSNIDSIINYNYKTVLAFDTAGIEQLEIKNKLSEEDWNASYQGDEGSISFYIDAVNRTFNIDSHTLKPAHSIDNLSLKEMFKIIKGDSNENNKK